MSPRLPLSRFDAGIFDLDGVLTRTARVHAAAWKPAFDALLTAPAIGQPPFDAEREYRAQVDGRPRLEGARALLASRGIVLAEGRAGDAPGTGTLQALCALKNRSFREALARGGVELFDSSVAFVQRVRARGLRTAVVSSSRNCRAILAAAGLEGAFEAVVDGEDGLALGLTGKPQPDAFLEAARRLRVAPQRAFVVEDALAGVEAARRGGFGCVIGIDRAHQAAALRAYGADIVVDDLSRIETEDRLMPHPSDAAPASSSSSSDASPAPALDRIDAIVERMRRGRPAFFLDYDGTLTPIVDRPQDANIAESMRAVIRRLAELHPVAVVSGRDLADVRARVGLDAIYFAGSHGFDIAGPNGERHQHPEALARRDALDAAQALLEERLGGLPGALVERKSFSLAVHYRLVADQDFERVRAAVDEASAAQPRLRVQSGKKVFDFQPAVPWDKGRAVLWLMQAIAGASAASGSDRPDAPDGAGPTDAPALVPLYIGDDVTDEDAFAVLADHGVTVAVLDAPRPTRAAFTLGSTAEVERFLALLADRLEAEAQR